MYLLLLCCSFSCKSEPESRVVRAEKQVLVLIADESANYPLVKEMRQICQDSSWKLTVTHQTGWLDEDSIYAFSLVVLEGFDAGVFQPWQQTGVQRYVEAGGGLLVADNRLRYHMVWPWLEKTCGIVPPDTLEPAPVSSLTADNTGPFTEKNVGNGKVATPAFEDVTTVPSLKKALSATMSHLIGANAYDYAQASAIPAPRDTRFTHLVLDQGDLYEPMELTVLPDGKVIYIERRGLMKMYLPETKTVKLLSAFDVCTEGNYEDGLLGLAIDPNFTENHYLYLYYSPPCENTNQWLSRFTMSGDSLIRESEKVILEVAVQRETCCHSGGSITFGPDGSLYLSTGDNTSSKESDGYSPLDERPNRGPFDAQKSSSNAGDLRGKVIRIRPNAYGGYEVPEGNLFPKDSKQGRPEIYAMGCRNPFRIAVDSKTGWLYWGDVGPDVGQEGKYGPQSYDEFNQARKAGYFGWPYFMADNKAFNDRNFENDSVGAPFNPAMPVNNSPNNYGPKQLPPSNPAAIWYPYGESPDFPNLGIGSRSAMSGPIYHRTPANDTSKVAFPDYFEGKWFIYEWARSWIRLVSFDSAGNVAKIEPFMPEMELVKPIDMEFGPDGALYFLEYGQNYFMKNPEARLVKIEYAGSNRQPVPDLRADVVEGGTPLKVNFSAANSKEYDVNDSLCYEWYFTESEFPHSFDAEASFTFSKPGVYHPLLVVTDTYGDTAQATIEIRVGNTAPAIEVMLEGNTQFYKPGESRKYQVTVKDPEDESQGGIASARKDISLVFVPDGHDLEVLLGGRKIDASMRFAKGLSLIEGSDCKSCHTANVHSVGPSYHEISDRYKQDASAVDRLARKVISGGNGVWGEKIMASHPQHTLEQTTEMVKYILSIANNNVGSLPDNGTISLSESSNQGAYLLAATYLDGGGNGLPALERRVTYILRQPWVEVEDAVQFKEMAKGRYGANREFTVLKDFTPGTVILYPQGDLTAIKTATLRLLPVAGGVATLHLDSPDGPVVATWRTPSGNADLPFREVSAPVLPTSGLHNLYLVMGGSDESGSDLFFLNGIRLGF